MMLALLWKIAGIHLFVGHLFMLPFALGLIFQFHRFISFFSENKLFIHLTLILLLVDTTVLSQIIVVSTDLPLILFFFMSVNAVLYKKRNILYFSLIALSLTHFRGTVSCVIVFLFDYFLQVKNKKNNFFIENIFSIVPQYLPFFIIQVAYYIFHYKNTGWLFEHENSPWAGCYERVDFNGFLFNTGILVWRLIDFGRLFYWIVLTYLSFLFLQKNSTSIIASSPCRF
ncbi:MAG: hypothetical protein HC906_05250 [Bacteroidales bacterium]|nr:hypothetical protein [Bacteroidales bacterium]